MERPDTALSTQPVGLAITKEMVEKLGGEISVSSSAEDGTVFQVTLCR